MAILFFERFTDRARQVLVMAHEEAEQHNDYVGTEHILLALIDEGEGIAAKVLESLGISREVVQQRLVRLSPQFVDIDPALHPDKELDR